MRENKKQVEFCRVDGKYFVTCDGDKICIAIKNIYRAIMLNNIITVHICTKRESLLIFLQLFPIQKLLLNTRNYTERSK